MKTPKRLNMTPMKLAILAAIDDFSNENGYQPEIREIGEMVGLSSSSTIHAHLQNLREMGEVDWVDGQRRTLHIKERLAA